MLWHAMSKTGNGYKRPSMKRDGSRTDIRKDKVDEDGNRLNPLLRRMQRRYARFGQ